MQRKWRIVAGLATGALLAGAALSVVDLTGAVAGPSDPITAGIAAYFPDSAPNRAAITSRTGLSVVVMNTLQAPGASVAVGDYKGAGKRVFGYFAAGYAPSGANGISPKSLAQLQATASAMFTSYPTIDGLFLDEVLNNDANGCAAPAAFYVSFYQWLQSAYPGKSLILNPGTALCSAFAGAADIFLVFENRLGFYRSAFQSYFALADFDWIRALPNARVWSIVYGVPVTDMPALMNELADYAGLVTVLSDNADHPYSNVPPVAELDLMNARATGASLPTTTTTTIAGGVTTTTTSTTTTTIFVVPGGGSAGPAIVTGTTTTTTSATGPSPSTTTAAPVTTTSTSAPPTTTAPLPVVTTIRPAPAVVVPSPVSPVVKKAATTRLVRRTVRRCRTVVPRATKTKKATKKRLCRRVTVRVRVKIRS
jgi:hypothetical protein